MLLHSWKPYLFAGSALLLLAWAGCSDESAGGEPATSAQSTSSSTTVTSGAGGSSAGAGGSTSSSGGAGAVTFNCNPVTNDGCSQGDACDLSDAGNFVCYNTDNSQGVCESCKLPEGPYCAPTMTCVLGDESCHRYCCNDADCGPSLSCDKGPLSNIGNGEVGICAESSGAGGAGGSGGSAGGSGGSAGGSGGAGGSETPGCTDVPTDAPSNGSCVVIGS